MERQPTGVWRGKWSMEPKMLEKSQWSWWTLMRWWQSRAYSKTYVALSLSGIWEMKVKIHSKQSVLASIGPKSGWKRYETLFLMKGNRRPFKLQPPLWSWDREEIRLRKDLEAEWGLKRLKLKLTQMITLKTYIRKGMRNLRHLGSAKFILVMGRVRTENFRYCDKRSWTSNGSSMVIKY